MANAEKLWESFDDILAHREMWDQGCYVYCDVIVDAVHWTECGTTQCIAGFRCLRDGLRPTFRYDVLTLINPKGEYVDPRDHAARQFELDREEQRALFNYYTGDTAALKERIQEIIDGKWRDDEPSW